MVQKWKQLPLFMMTAKQKQTGTRQNGTGCEFVSYVLKSVLIREPYTRLRAIWFSFLPIRGL